MATARLAVGTRERIARRRKVEGNGGGSGSGSGGGGKYCDHCKTTGHNKDKCWKLHPELAPQWYKDMKERSSSEAAGSSVEMMLVQVDEGEPQDFGVACL